MRHLIGLFIFIGLSGTRILPCESHSPPPLKSKDVMVEVRLLEPQQKSLDVSFLPTAPAPDEQSASVSNHGKLPPRNENSILTPKRSKLKPTGVESVFLPTVATPQDFPLSDQLATPPKASLSSTTTPMTLSVLEASRPVPVTATALHQSASDTSSLSPLGVEDIAGSSPTSKAQLPDWAVSLDDVLEVWEPRFVAARWSGWLRALQDPSLGSIGASPDDITWRSCSRDVAAYLEGLREAKGWAVMLSDASGRAPRGLFDGNGYWLGSRALCSDLDLTGARGSTRTAILFRRQDVDPPAPPSAETTASPFPLSFFVAKLAVNVSSPELYLAQRSTLGLCLPASCSPIDVSRLLRAAIRRPDAVRLLGVRQLHQNFQVWTDPTFLALVVVGGLATVCALVATIMDVLLERRGVFTSPGDEDAVSEPPPKPPRLARGCDVILRLQGGRDGNVAVKGVGREQTPRAPPPPAPVPAWRVAVHCFSLRVNLRKVFSLRAGAEVLAPVHGLRVLSLLWVILAHVSLIIFHLADNKDFRKRAEGDFLYQALSSGTFSVDTFFFLSGLLLSYIYFQSCSVRSVDGVAKRLQQFGTMILYRFLRLTPPYMFVLGVVQVCMQYFYATAVAELPTRDHVTCPQFWWRNLLYINTLYSSSQRCMAWSWYLADDTQFYVIGTALLIIAVSFFWVAVGAMAAFLLSSWVTTAFVAYSAQHVTKYWHFKEPFAHYDELYDKPWTRMGPYLIGMATGWILWKTRCQIRMHPVAAAAGWLLSGAALAGCVFGLFGTTLSPASSAAFVALSHSAWALAVAWVLVACLSGRGGWVARLLAWRGLFPASRLCYCAYLLHPLLIRSMALHADSSFHMSRDHVAVLFLGFCVASFSLSLVLSVFLEAPVVSLLSVLRAQVSSSRPAPRPPGAEPGQRRPGGGVPVPAPCLPEAWKTAGFGY